MGGNATMWRLGLVAVLAAAGVAAVPVPAQAHRHGCHRWHSCPSDTGSYVCGDLGYRTYCGTGESEPAREADFTAPDAPAVGKPTLAAGGRVSIRVTAERGSRIEVVDESKTVVARARATGTAQTVTFTARTGRHTYVVRATDGAGNVSLDSDPLTVDVDATAPAVRDLKTDPARPDFTATVVSFTTEPGARYDITVAGREEQARGTAGADGSVAARLWLPDGTYTATVRVQDATGNAVTKTVPVTVRVPALALTVKRASEVGASPVVFVIFASPGSRGTLTLPGRAPASFTLDDSGQAMVSLPLPDGAYPAGSVALTDQVGRTGTAAIPSFVIDTTPPGLTVTADETKAEQGVLALAVRAENGASVSVRGDLGDAGRLDETFTARSAPTSITRKTPTGTYTVTVVARDAAGNETRRVLAVAVVDPLTPVELAIGLLFLLLPLAGAAALGWLVWRRRHRIAAWWVHRREQARLQAALVAHERTLANYRTAYEAWQRADRAWADRRSEIALLVDAAEHETGSRPPDLTEVKLRRDERLVTAVPGALVEMRSRQGVVEPVIAERGTAYVTSQRLVFVGSRKREWAFDKLLEMRHDGPDTVIRVSNRQKVSGVRFLSDAEKTRVLLDIAIADARGERERAVAAVRRMLEEHDAARPVPPQPPGEPPVAASPRVPAESYSS